MDGTATTRHIFGWNLDVITQLTSPVLQSEDLLLFTVIPRNNNADYARQGPDNRTHIPLLDPSAATKLHNKAIARLQKRLPNTSTATKAMTATEVCRKIQHSASTELPQNQIMQDLSLGETMPIPSAPDELVLVS